MCIHSGVRVYFLIAAVLFVIGIFVGKVFKKDVLHGKVMLGVMNSALLSIVWPITVCFFILGLIHDAVDAWKKL